MRPFGKCVHGRRPRASPYLFPTRSAMMICGAARDKSLKGGRYRGLRAEWPNGWLFFLPPRRPPIRRYSGSCLGQSEEDAEYPYAMMFPTR